MRAHANSDSGRRAKPWSYSCAPGSSCSHRSSTVSRWWISACRRIGILATVRGPVARTSPMLAVRIGGRVLIVCYTHTDLASCDTRLLYCPNPRRWSMRCHPRTFALIVLVVLTSWLTSLLPAQDPTEVKTAREEVAQR